MQHGVALVTEVDIAQRLILPELLPLPPLPPPSPDPHPSPPPHPHASGRSPPLTLCTPHVLARPLYSAGQADLGLRPVGRWLLDPVACPTSYADSYPPFHPSLERTHVLPPATRLRVYGEIIVFLLSSLHEFSTLDRKRRDLRRDYAVYLCRNLRELI